MAHWLMKSEPEHYGWADLVRDGGTEWDGVRNNAARLHLKAMKPGDEAFLYHSMSDKVVVRAIREDQRLARGEVGYLDADPLCDCQDYGKITAQVRTLTRPTKRSAEALVHVDLGIGEARDLRLKLVLTADGWRVADVGSA